MLPFADGVVVYDDFAKRATVLDLDFNVVRTLPAAATPRSAIVRSDRGGIMAAFISTRERVGFSLHEFDSTWNVTRSFAPWKTPYRGDLATLFTRTLSPGFESSTYLVAHYQEYAFELCRYRDDSCRVFLRPAEWFPSPDPASLIRRNYGTMPPLSELGGVSQDASRYVWTIARVGDPRWKSIMEQVNASEYAITDYNRYFDSIVERIDLSTGHVIASTKVDVVLRQFIGPGLAWYSSEDDDGYARIHIVRFVMDGHP